VLLLDLSLGRYTPEQLYSSKRDAIQNEIYEETMRKVDGQHVQLNAVLVRDVTLPTSIKEAIQRKLTQEQEALEYEFRLEKARQEAEKVRIEAEGKAVGQQAISSITNTKYSER
jgi:regulator of protease activity HflC (stomatin/prohibitin superfamily)